MIDCKLFLAELNLILLALRENVFCHFDSILMIIIAFAHVGQQSSTMNVAASSRNCLDEKTFELQVRSQFQYITSQIDVKKVVDYTVMTANA